MTAQIISHAAWRKAAQRRNRPSTTAYRVVIRFGSIEGTFDVQIEPHWQGACDFGEDGVTLDSAHSLARKIGKWLRLPVVDLVDGSMPPGAL